MRGSRNSSEKCKKGSAANRVASSLEEAPTQLSLRDELPGVDYKNKLGPRSQRHNNKLNLSTDEGESRFLNSFKKEVRKKENVRRLQTAFQQGQGDDDQGAYCPSTALASKTVWCTNQSVSMNLSSPLDEITSPAYVKRWRNNDLIKDLPRTRADDEDEESSGGPLESHVQPTVIALNMKWRNGIVVKQCHKFTTRTINLEPVMRRTEFDFETKTKFSAQVDQACDILFPDYKNKLMVLDGNLVFHGSPSDSSVKVARSDKLKHDDSPSAPCEGTGAGNPHAREWKEFTDLQEHRILVIPSFSKTGFDMDLTKRYEFPYQAKFVIGRRAYHHKFLLKVPLAKSPQHYGLVFTFSEDVKGHSKLRIKSLLTVYSVFPVSTKFACLKTYEKDNLDEPDVSDSNSTSRKKCSNESARLAKTAVSLVTENLREENLVTSSCGGGFYMERELAQRGQDHFRFRRLYDETLTGKKEKKKRHLLNTISQEQQEKDRLNGKGKPFRKI